MRHFYSRKELEQDKCAAEFNRHIDNRLNDIQRGLFEREQVAVTQADSIRTLEIMVKDLEREVEEAYRQIESSRADQYKLIERLGRLGDP